MRQICVGRPQKPYFSGLVNVVSVIERASDSENSTCCRIATIRSSSRARAAASKSSSRPALNKRSFVVMPEYSEFADIERQSARPTVLLRTACPKERTCAAWSLPWIKRCEALSPQRGLFGKRFLATVCEEFASLSTVSGKPHNILRLCATYFKPLVCDGFR